MITCGCPWQVRGHYWQTYNVRHDDLIRALLDPEESRVPAPGDGASSSVSSEANAPDRTGRTTPAPPPFLPDTSGNGKGTVQRRFGVCAALAVVAAAGLLTTGLLRSTGTTSANLARAESGTHGAILGPHARPMAPSRPGNPDEHRLANIKPLLDAPTPTADDTPTGPAERTPSSSKGNSVDGATRQGTGQEVLGSKALPPDSTGSTAGTNVKPRPNVAGPNASPPAPAPATDSGSSSTGQGGSVGDGGGARPMLVVGAADSAPTPAPAPEAVSAPSPWHSAEWYQAVYQHAYDRVWRHSDSWRSASPWSSYFHQGAQHAQSMYSSLYWHACSELDGADAATRNLNPYDGLCVN